MRYDYEDVKQQLIRISNFVEVVDLKAFTSISALESQWSDYEDAVQCFTATNEASDCIVTRNKKDFQKASIPIYTLGDFFALYPF